MSAPARTAGFAVGAVVATVVVGSAVARDAARGAEAVVTTRLVRALGGHVATLSDRSILVVPRARVPFRVVVTPSCSSLAAVLALFALVVVLTRGNPWRRGAAFGLAAVIVVAGNVVRIAASLAVGLRTGRSSLVLFHDVVGSVFGVASVLIGFFVVVWVLLPARAEGPALEVLGSSRRKDSHELVGN